MTFEITQVDSFDQQKELVPKSVRVAIRKRVIPELRIAPDQAQGSKIIPVRGGKGLWRYKIGDYRVVYQVVSSSHGHEVRLLLVGHRKEIYDGLDNKSDDSPGIRIIEDEVDEHLEVEPSPEQLEETVDLPAQEQQAAAGPDAPLPQQLTSQLLQEWGVPEEYHEVLVAASTERELIAAVPEWVLERVMYGLWPVNIEETLQQPLRAVPEGLDSSNRSDDDGDLFELLLKLDPEQKAFVSRFQQPDPEGPWLLKGGPGSGKSVVALYCIKALIDEQSSKLPGQRKPLKILLTTYTNSLANAAKQLSRSLTGDLAEHEIDVRTVNSLTRDFSTQRPRQMVSLTGKQAREAANQALEHCRRHHSPFPFDFSDRPFLLDEVEWVIAGQDLRNAEQYLNEADRQGRRRALGRRQREAVWAFYERFASNLQERGFSLWVEQERDALANASPRYDYVFIDEAQDLKPVAVRFLAALARKPSNLFLTADSNQSIYGTGMSWSQIADDLNFSGRAQILKKNHRTTKEIWRAISQLSPQAQDSETLAVEPVYNGSSPVLAHYPNLTAWAERLDQFFFSAMRKERVGPGACAVLVPTNDLLDKVASRISPVFRPKAFRSREVDIAYEGVKVLTMHSAKGLEFPIVALLANEDSLPGPEPFHGDLDEWAAQHHRLLFVAASRAMRHLIVFAKSGNESRFLKTANSDCWEIEQL